MDMMKRPNSKLGLALMTASAVGLALVTMTTVSHSAELSQAQTAPLKLAIASECQGRQGTFRVKNAGEAWPKSSTFAIYRLADGKAHLIASRRMRLNAGQQASFRIKAVKNTTGQLGLSVDPSWYERRRVLDAKLVCR